MANRKDEAQEALEKMKAISKKADEFLVKINTEMAEVDKAYVEMLINDDVNKLKAAKEIIENEK